MSQHIERSPGLTPKQTDLNFRSEEQLRQSIREKIARNEPLDPEELALKQEDIGTPDERAKERHESHGP